MCCVTSTLGITAIILTGLVESTRCHLYITSTNRDKELAVTLVSALVPFTQIDIVTISSVSHVTSTVVLTAFKLYVCRWRNRLHRLPSLPDSGAKGI